MLFGEQKHERITKKLIEDVIGEKVETIELEQTPYLWGESTNDKVGIIDVRATINNKNPIDIEMQIIDNEDIEKRALFYWSKLYTKQLERGDKYSETKTAINKGLKQGLEQGLQQGLKQGLEKGRIEGIKEVAKAMKQKRLSITEIMEITGLTKEEIEKL